MVRIGLVGCGFMGRMHGNVYRALEGAELVACADIKPDVVAQYAQDFGCTPYSTLDALLDHESVDAVDVCLPTHLHREFVERAAARGKHVFCEKPIALTLEDADRMIAAVRAAGVQMMVGHCIRYWPEYALLKELVEASTLGKLTSLHLLRFGAFPTWSSDNWLADESKAGGGVLDMHIHDTDFALYLLGKPDTQNSWGTVTKHGADHVFTTMTYGSTVVHLEGGWNLPAGTPFKHAFRAIFERGAAIMDAGPLTIYEDGKEPCVPEIAKMQAAGGGNIDDLGGYYLELADFVQKISSGQPVDNATPESARDTLAVVLEEVRQVKAFARR